MMKQVTLSTTDNPQKQQQDGETASSSGWLEYN